MAMRNCTMLFGLLIKNNAMTTQNNQITEDFVSPQLAKLLAAKGFDAPSLRFYDSQDIPCVSGRNEPFNWNEFKDSRCPSFSRPTVQTVIKWLISKGFYVHTILSYESMIDDNDELVGNRTFWIFEIQTIKDGKTVYCEEEKEYSTHEKATDAAIIHCLTEFIEP